MEQFNNENQTNLENHNQKRNQKKPRKHVVQQPLPQPKDYEEIDY